VAFDAFLKLGDIDGESTDAKHPRWIEIESFSLGVEQSARATTSGSGAGVGKATFQDLHFTARQSTATVPMLIKAATGQHIPDAELNLVRLGSKSASIFYTIKLTDVLISSLHEGGIASTDVVPADQFSLNFSKVSWSYAAQRPDGSLSTPIEGSYDLQQNKAG
jgi:type VI secretion system secreted protein Hcp